ncbi:MAG: peptidylprolyl isomerase [Paramuribaculum sp.]|nr:peptidylprolyl isomerase [Paramuribaculum sp.]
MKTRSFVKSLIAVAVVLPFVVSGKVKDPVVMTVGGNDVRLSEFEYLYKKNANHKSDTVSLDKYVDMFVNYKLKVRAAIDEDMDTLPDVRRDIEQFRVELAAPYMRDSIIDDSLARLIYSHKLVDVEARGIVLTGDKRALADSLHAVLAAGGDFAALAKRYSDDKSSKNNGGYFGYVYQGKLPTMIEDVLYETPVGEITPVMGSHEMGWCIMKVLKRRPNPGEVKARHIFKMTMDKSGDEVKRKKHEIDSIYSLIKKGVPFADLAPLSDEPSGKKNGGELPWFGVGRMVPQFERAAFALKPGEISAPIKSPFGYHIIMCDDKRPVGSYESMKEALLKEVLDGDRASKAVETCLDHHLAQIGFATDSVALNKLYSIIQSNGGFNEASRKAIGEAMVTVYSTDGKPMVTSTELAEAMGQNDVVDAEAAISVMNKVLESLKYGKAKESFISDLARKSARYNYLFNEYSDGILLCEISNEKVWNRANTDAAGLEDCFRRNRKMFKWDRPHYRGYLIAAKDDSLAQAAHQYLTENNFDEKDYSTELRKRFLNDVKIEKVIVGKGDNAVVDYLVFGAPKPKIKARWKGYLTFGGVVLDQPEKATDIKGAVSQKYQQELEERWIKELRSNYDVKVNRAVVNKLRK